MPDNEAPDEVPRAVDSWELVEIVLLRGSVERGPGDASRPRDVDAPQVEIEAEFNDGELAYCVAQELKFNDEGGDLVATVQATFRLVYSVGAVSPGEDQVSGFAQSVILQSVPFFRELVANLTNRIGVPRFMLPLVRRSDIGPATPILEPSPAD